MPDATDTDPTLTATAGGTPLLAPLLALWDTSAAMLLERLAGLTDEEYRWKPTPDAADLGADLRPQDTATGHTRTIAWSLCHLADLCLARADYTDGAHDRPLEYLPFTASAADAVEQTRAAMLRWRRAVAGASEQQALQVGYSAWPLGLDTRLPFVDIVWWVDRELIHHGADIALVRDLYAAR